MNEIEIEIEKTMDEMLGKGFPPLGGENYPIYDLYFRGKNPKKVSDWVFLGALIERSAKSFKSRGMPRFFVDNRKRPKRLHKKICKRWGFQTSSKTKVGKQDWRYIDLVLRMSIRSIRENKSPYMTDVMMEFMLNGGPAKMVNMMFHNREKNPKDYTADNSSPPPTDAPPSTDSSSQAQP